MNILITTQHGETAGATYSIYYLCKGLSEKGHKVVLAVRFDSLLHRLVSSIPILCEEIIFDRKYKCSLWKRLAQVVKVHNIELVYAQESRDRYVSIFSKLVFKYKAKLVLARRQRVVDNNLIKRLLYNRFADATVVISDGLYAESIALGFDKAKLKVIYNGLPKINWINDEKAIQNLKSQYNIGQNDIIIGCVARPKSQEDLLKVLRLLPIHYKLLLVGITLDDFEKKFNRFLNLELNNRITVVGILNNREVLYQHYKLMNMHVLPSKMDGFGLVLLEAMSLKVPVIGSNFGGIPDVIEHEKSGYVYELGNIEQLKNHIVRMATDQEIRSKFIEHGLVRAEYFSIENTIIEYEKFFYSLVEGKPK